MSKQNRLTDHQAAHICFFFCSLAMLSQNGKKLLDGPSFTRDNNNGLSDFLSLLDWVSSLRRAIHLPLLGWPFRIHVICQLEISQTMQKRRQSHKRRRMIWS